MEQIRLSLERLFDLLGPPSDLLESGGPARLSRMLRGFRHRFVTGEEVARLLEGVRRAREAWGSLNRYFVSACYGPAMRRGDGMVGAAALFARGLREPEGRKSYLLPEPERGSACKRLHLYLRWMARKDAVDPGVWTGVRPADLVVPMDTHMHRICGLLGLVDRRAADGRAALQATEGFRRLRPDDPVRYDFALTRIGMGGRLEELGPGLAPGY